jgi:threonyl-tRNA synthetase
VVIPIADRHADYGAQVQASLTERDLRVEVDDSADTMGAKIRKHQLAKVPYQLIVGDTEADEGTVAVRPRVGDQRKGVALSDFVDQLLAEVTSKGA